MDFDFSFLPSDAAVLDYLPGILPTPDSSIFISHYDFLPDKSMVVSNYTRSKFWVLVMRCITLIQDLGGVKGMKVIHYVSGNRLEDLVFRTASIFLGTIPVTINWQADILSQIEYKITVTDAKIMIIDDHTPNLPELKAKYPDIHVVNIKDIYASQPIAQKDLESFLCDTDVARMDDIRCIIFTSGRDQV